MANDKPSVGYGRPPAEHQFKQGNPGRAKGSRNKLGEAFVSDLFADWQEHGVATIEAARVKDPVAYLRVVASLMPREVKFNSDGANLSDDELDARIRELARLVFADTTDDDQADAAEAVH